jgi:prepilin-type N-terminal cleavage/methylation domain-containing protein
MKIRSEQGFTLVELLIVVAIIAIVAALAVPGLLRSRMSANEASAIGTLRTIVSGQVAYSTSCGRNGYASGLPVLGVPPPGSALAFIDEDIALPIALKSGYAITLASGLGGAPSLADCNGTVTTNAYYATAVPVGFGGTGARSFAVNTTGTIWQASAAAAPAEPFAAPATPIQ